MCWQLQTWRVLPRACCLRIAFLGGNPAACGTKHGARNGTPRACEIGCSQVSQLLASVTCTGGLARCPKAAKAPSSTGLAKAEGGC